MKNRILLPVNKGEFSSIIDDMYKTLPDMMKRKIPESEIQAAFAIDYITNRYHSGELLCVGSYEDVTYEYLKAKGVSVVGIDPQINVDLHTYRKSTDKKFDMVFSVSVIEHVENDEEFIEDISNLLCKNGTGILTTDFLENWFPSEQQALKIPNLSKSTTKERLYWVKKLNESKKERKPFSPKPKEDYRLYTSKDYKRLSNVLEKNGCFFVDEFIANVEPYFTYDLCKYSFSTMVFRKIS